MPSTPSDHETKDFGYQDNGNSLSLVKAMEAADRLRKVFRKRKDPIETEQMVPPGTWQGMAAFAATGLLVMTPLRRSILKATGPRGNFQGFVDLVVTPILAVGAAQVGLVIGTLYGSSYYLDRLAVEAATTTKTISSDTLFGLSKEVMSVRLGSDDKLSYSPTTESLAAERQNIVAELCQEVLSLSSLSSSSSETSTQEPSFSSWDPRSKTMNSLLRALDNCRRREY